MGKITKGTKEWATTNVNIYSGCSHDCKYCYAKKMAIRFNRKTEENWKEMELNQAAYKKGYAKRKGRIMFPTTHDITPETVDTCLEVILKMVKAGNEVLITTKPAESVIKVLCDGLNQYKDLVQFRFTITSYDDAALLYWEPGAPSYNERVAALKHAFNSGFRTSLSIEPCLVNEPQDIIDDTEEFVTESIWIGPLNYCGKHQFNSDDSLRWWLKWLSDNPLVRFKDSVYNQLKVKPKHVKQREKGQQVLF
jgi:DNA repair photolyase